MMAKTLFNTGNQRSDLVAQAARHICTAAAIDDSGSALAQQNLAIGMAKILYVQDKLGYPQDACFVATPDLTPTRGQAKWQWGLSAGGVLSWGDGDRPLVFLDLNVSVGCALTGGMDCCIEPGELIRRITGIREHLPVIMGVQTKWDYGSGNHFINVYKNLDTADHLLPPYIFIVHGSGREMKGATSLGIGLDFQASQPLGRLATCIPTPLGPCHILQGAAALDFAATYHLYREFTLAKQQWIARALFNEFSLISNVVHHGFVDANRAVLGCYHFSRGDDTLFPVTLRGDLPAFLVRGRSNLDLNTVDLPLSPPAHILPRIASANVIPHGAGAMYPQVLSVDAVMHMNDQRILLLRGKDHNLYGMADLHALEYRLRGLEVMDRLKRLRLGDVAATLQPLLSITI